MPSQILLEEQRVFDNKWVTLIAAPNEHNSYHLLYTICVSRYPSDKNNPQNTILNSDAQIEYFEKGTAEAIFYRVLKNDFFGEDWLYYDSITREYFTFEELMDKALNLGLFVESISEIIKHVDDVEHRCIFEVDEDEFLEEFKHECDLAQSLGYKWSIEEVLRHRFNLEFWKLPRSYRRALTD